MGQGESSQGSGEAEMVPSTPLGVVEKNTMDLWSFLLLLVATLLAITFLTIEIIVFFFPDIVTNNHVCGSVGSSSSTAPTDTKTSTTAASISTAPKRQPMFDSYASWLTRIRTTNANPNNKSLPTKN